VPFLLLYTKFDSPAAFVSSSIWMSCFSNSVVKLECQTTRGMEKFLLILWCPISSVSLFCKGLFFCLFCSFVTDRGGGEAMSDTPTLAEKAQGLHIGGGNSSSTTGIAEKPTGISSVRSAATAAAAVYAWRKASKSKDGRSRANLSVVPVRSSADGFTTPTTTISNGTPPPGGTGGRRLPSPGSSPSLLLAYVSASETSAEPLPTTADDIVDGTGMSVLGEARAKLATVERRTIDQWRAATAEARAASKVEKGEERIRQLERQVLKLEDELRDSAAIEVALYSVVAEHASSAHKVHTPARRLARFYIHLYKNWSPERRPSIARNIVLGLVLVVRACGNDVPRSFVFLKTFPA
jgi:hypothetical protein